MLTGFVARPRKERIVIAFLLFSMLLTVGFAFVQAVTTFQVTLDPIQLLVLGAVASVLIQVFKWIVGITGSQIDPKYVRASVFVVSMGMGWYWIRPDVPVDADFMDLALAIIAGLSVIGGSAKLIYDILLERVLKGLDNTLQLTRFKFEPSSKPVQ